MSWMQIALTAAAAAIAFSGPIYSMLPAFRLSRKRVVSYQEAMIALASVRSRMVDTGGVPGDAAKAIEVITHALVDGSDS